MFVLNHVIVVDCFNIKVRIIKAYFKLFYGYT